MADPQTPASGCPADLIYPFVPQPAKARQRETEKKKTAEVNHPSSHLVRSTIFFFFRYFVLAGLSLIKLEQVRIT